jgi:monoamine oxidase
VFWDKSFDWHEYLHTEKGRWTEWVSFAKVNDTPVLLGFSAAKRARTMEQWSDAQIKAEAMDALRDMFGSSVPEPVAHQFTRWSQDPFAYGSYSFNATGSSNDDRESLSQPINQRIFWAGEACSSLYPGTVHGAHISGLNAAKALQKTLKKSSA